MYCSNRDIINKSSKQQRLIAWCEFINWPEKQALKITSINTEHV